MSIVGVLAFSEVMFVAEVKKDVAIAISEFIARRDAFAEGIDGISGIGHMPTVEVEDCNTLHSDVYSWVRSLLWLRNESPYSHHRGENDGTG